jgi:hypothetical protein
VALGIGAVYLLGHDDEPSGGPTVAAPPSASASATPTPAPTPTTQPTAAATTAPPVAVVTTPPPATAAPVVPVSVLNNSRVSHLAEQAARRFRAGGWPTPVVGNYRGGTIGTTTVYYAPGGRPSALRFARQFGIDRVAPRFPGLPTRGMTVVLTRDYR